MEFANSHHQRVVSHLRAHPLPGNMRDLYRVAYRIVAARADAHKQLSPADAAEYGLAALSETAAPPSGTASQAVARAFADSSPLDGVVQSAGIISTKNLNLEIQTFIATEIRRISKTSGRPVEDLCDVSDRSLRTWTRNEVDGTELPPCGSSVPKTAKRPRRKKS